METNPRRPCFVYLLQAGGAIKIGIAVNIGARVLSLQSGNPLPLSVIGRRKFASTLLALEAERELHALFSDRRAQGEWFWIEPQDAIGALERFGARVRPWQGPPAPSPKPVAYDFDAQIRLAELAEFYDEA